MKSKCDLKEDKSAVFVMELDLHPKCINSDVVECFKSNFEGALEEKNLKKKN